MHIYRGFISLLISRSLSMGEAPEMHVQLRTLHISRQQQSRSAHSCRWISDILIHVMNPPNVRPKGSVAAE